MNLDTLNAYLKQKCFSVRNSEREPYYNASENLLWLTSPELKGLIS